MASSINLSTSQLVEIFQSYRIAVLSTLGFAIVLPLAISDYRTYLSYGPGGLPYNVRGWLMANVLKLFAREQHSSAPYDDPDLPFADEPGYLPDDFPPKRSSPKPKIGPHPAPQRQLEQLPSDEMRKRLIDRFAELGRKAQEKELVEVKQSFYERQHSALFVSPRRNWHTVAEQTNGELSHVHAGLDGTIHVVLHPKDCKKVLDNGWGQRHAFSGSTLLQRVPRARLPVNYLLIYAPRDDAELDVALRIVEAAIQFMAGTRDTVA
ncbi:hypothetical protein P280DRAFT_152362 [Massarina eburnea CBS 473.64]|uniref:Luciferase domain-containing protein n=1 Tax=Massarina eburnea CBS 473.64 TaxID=1395130 RepID=A0A6A6RQI5_9PLEO|nr:hypothetical protein P280DRAFT_152362 [Massarina eburnea CBS 473.64]